MSDTISVDIVGPSYWAFMATVMAECLEKYVNEQKVTPSDIPEGVFEGAEEFFSLALDAAGNARPGSPPASISAYVFATDALRGSLHSFPTTDQELQAKLEKYAAFLKSLTKPHSLTEESDVETATTLRDFFFRLAQDGEIEVYERSVKAEPLPTGYRFR
ncbi:MAG TPA: hypothetical protein VF791_20205 [Pyrinomonadaceae bacterium]